MYVTDVLKPCYTEWSYCPKSLLLITFLEHARSISKYCVRFYCMDMGTWGHMRAVQVKIAQPDCKSIHSSFTAPCMLSQRQVLIIVPGTLCDWRTFPRESDYGKVNVGFSSQLQLQQYSHNRTWVSKRLFAKEAGLIPKAKPQFEKTFPTVPAKLWFTVLWKRKRLNVT